MNAAGPPIAPVLATFTATLVSPFPCALYQLWTAQPKLETLQKKAQWACGWRSKGFPGSQPVSMDRHNLGLLREKPYKVSTRKKIVYTTVEF